MKVLVTGASGFLGSRLAAAWGGQGHCVVETAARAGRRPPQAAAEDGGQERPKLRFRLGEALPADALEGVEAIVHAAHAFGRGTFDLNVRGTQAVFHAGRGAGVRRQIFVSSASALPGAASEYGRTKFELERFFLEEGQTIVRPGLVLGAGGMFGRILDNVLRFPVLPLLDGGDDAVPVVAVADFVASMTALLESGRGGAFNLCNADTVTMRRLLETTARLARRRRMFVAIPIGLAERLLVAIERSGMPFPVGADSLRSVRQSRGTSPRTSDLRALVGTETTLEEALAAALLERSRRRQACQQG